MSRTDHSSANAPRLLEPLLHLGFALTGVGTVLLGCILPVVAQQWHLRDKDAGLLMLVQFAASASAALLVRGNLWNTLAIGYALFGAGGVGILLLQQRSLPAFAAFGLGMGLAMTSTNLLVGRRNPQRMGAALALLNFSWSAGSVACPILAAAFLLHFPSRTAFGAIGLLALPFTLLPLLAERKATDVAASDSLASMGVREAPIIIHYALLAFLYVGIEASVGNWMSTYATRSAAWTFAGSTVAVAIFWAAIVVGRATTPAALAWTSEVRLYRGAVIAAAAGIGLLLLAHSGKSVLVASAITGLALAPVFPLILASFLREIGPSRNAGWVFAMAGVGGAVLSWLTGVTSSSAGSLRIGLLVPGAAALLMVALLGRRPMQRDSTASANIEGLPSASEFTALQHAEAAPGPNGRPFPKNL